MSDSGGFIYDKDGVTEEKLSWIMQLKNVRRSRIKEYAEHFIESDSCSMVSVRGVFPCECAFPAPRKDEISGDDAKMLLKTAASLSRKQPICRPRQRELISSSAKKFFMVRARPPMPAAWHHQALKWRRTPCACRGAARRSRSTSPPKSWPPSTKMRGTPPPPNMAARAILSSVQISPVSPRSLTPCSTKAWSNKATYFDNEMPIVSQRQRRACSNMPLHRAISLTGAHPSQQCTPPWSIFVGAN